MNPNRVLPAASVIAMTAWLSALAIRLPPRDGDLLWQRWLGERILHEHAIPRALGAEAFAATGASWTPQEWLFSLALAWTTSRGAPWIVPLACALVAGLALAITVLRCRRRGVGAIGSSAAALLCALSMLQSFGARAQVVGWGGSAGVLWLLELDSAFSWFAVPLTVVWANLHASVFLAPFLAAIFSVIRFARDHKLSRSVLRSIGITAACSAATLATPFGIGLFRYTVSLMTSPIRHSISEWAPTSTASAAFVLAALPLLLMLAVFGGRASLQDRVLAGIFLIVLFTAIRNVPIFVLAVAPIAFSTLPERRTWIGVDRSSGFAGWSAVAAVTAAGLVLAVLSWQRAPALADAIPYGPALISLHDRHAPPRIFCEDFAWCSLFLNTSARVFIDGRSDPYPAEIWREYREVIDGRRDWAAVLDRRCIDTVLVRRDSALDSLLAEDASWRKSAGDRRARLYIRKNLTVCPRFVNAQSTDQSASIESDGRS